MSDMSKVRFVGGPMDGEIRMMQCPWDSLPKTLEFGEAIYPERAARPGHTILRGPLNRISIYQLSPGTTEYVFLPPSTPDFNDPKINRCPACGDLSSVTGGPSNYFVMCGSPECHTCGPRGITKEDAVRKWNAMPRR